MNRCEEFEILASAAIDGEISPAERSDLFGHLAQCCQCADFFASIVNLQVSAAKGGFALVQENASVKSGLKADRLLSPLKSRPLFSKVLGTRLSIPVPVAAGLAIAMILVFLMTRPKASEPVQRSVIQAVGNQTMLTLPIVRVP
jgi:anti-sigma factor RsiW